MNTFLFSLVGLLIVNVVYATNIGSHNTALEPTVNDASGTLVCCQSKCFIIEEFIQVNYCFRLFIDNLHATHCSSPHVESYSFTSYNGKSCCNFGGDSKPESLTVTCVH